MAIEYLVWFQTPCDNEAIAAAIGAPWEREQHVVVSFLDGLIVRTRTPVKQTVEWIERQFAFRPTAATSLRIVAEGTEPALFGIGMAVRRLVEVPGEMIVTHEDDLLLVKRGDERWIHRRLLWDARVAAAFAGWAVRD